MTSSSNHFVAVTAEGGWGLGAKETRASVTVVTSYTDTDTKKAQEILTELGLAAELSIVIIDARADNKPSGSTAWEQSVGCAAAGRAQSQGRRALMPRSTVEPSRSAPE